VKNIYLIRHAKSSWKAPVPGDLERPLNKRGERDAQEMGKRLAERGILPQLLITSPAKRAMDTCRLIASALGFPLEKVIIQPDLYHADEEEFLKVIRDIPGTIQSAILFGHNPGITDVSNKLQGPFINEIPTCGLVGCSFNVSDWKNTRFEEGTLEFMDYPKKKRL